MKQHRAARGAIAALVLMAVLVSTGLGVYAMRRLNRASPSFIALIAPALLLLSAIGILSLLFGRKREILLFADLSALFMCALLSFCLAPMLVSTAEQETRVLFDQYGHNDSVDVLVDHLQHDMRCCGLSNASYWRDSVWENETKQRYPSVAYQDLVPASCSRSGNWTAPYALFIEAEIFDRGCHSMFQEAIGFSLHLLMTASICLIGLLTGIALFWFFMLRDDNVPYLTLYS